MPLFLAIAANLYTIYVTITTYKKYMPFMSNPSIEKHPLFFLQEPMSKICNPLRQLNISTFAHVRVDSKNPGIAFSIGNRPNFFKNYMEKSYFNVDVFADPNHVHLPNCILWDLLDLKGKAYEMVKDASDFDYKHIFTIIKKSKDHTDYYNFGTHLNSPSIYQLYFNQFHLLESFIDYFHHNIGLLEPAYQAPIILTQPSSFIEETEDFPQLSSYEKTAYLRALGHKNISPLTAREQFYIPLIRQGFTAKEIAKHFDVAPRTAEECIKNIQRKFFATHKADLIRKLMSGGKLTE